MLSGDRFNEPRSSWPRLTATKQRRGGEGRRNSFRCDRNRIRLKPVDQKRDGERKTIAIGIGDAESRKIIRFLETIEFDCKKGNTALLSMIDVIRD